MFDTTVLSDLSPALALHLGAACAALLLGPFAIYRRRRDRMHRALGYAWVVAMTVLALSSFGLDAVVLPLVPGFGVIHLLSVWVLWQLVQGVRAARAGRIAAHRGRMAGLYWQGLGVAGALTLLPGRFLNDLLFAARPEAGLWAIAAILSAIGLGAVRSRLARPRGALRG